MTEIPMERFATKFSLQRAESTRNRTVQIFIRPSDALLKFASPLLAELHS